MMAAEELAPASARATSEPGDSDNKRAYKAVSCKKFAQASESKTTSATAAIATTTAATVTVLWRPLALYCLRLMQDFKLG